MYCTNNWGKVFLKYLVVLISRNKIITRIMGKYTDVGRNAILFLSVGAKQEEVNSNIYMIHKLRVI